VTSADLTAVVQRGFELSAAVLPKDFRVQLETTAVYVSFVPQVWAALGCLGVRARLE
jgi:hypothetical protein